MTGFTCPGSGSQTIKELSICCKINSGSPTIRIGIYTAAGVLVAGGATVTTVSGDSYTWQGHLTQASITPTQQPQLGVTYKIAWVAGPGVGDITIIQYEAGETDNLSYVSPYDSSDGLPLTLLAHSSWTGRHKIRCGVEPSAVHATWRQNNMNNMDNMVGGCNG